MLYKKAKEFLQEFKLPLNFDRMIKQLTEISLLNFNEHNCKKDLKITFDESMLFGKSASISETSISFNKTRLETLVALKIDDLDSNHLKNIYAFYNDYGESLNHTKFEICLYEFMKKYIEGGFERYFAQMGNYKTIKYELLDTIFHENEHIFQREYLKYLFSSNDCPTDSKTTVLFFTMLFNKIYEELKRSKVEFLYDRENYMFPIEFDARYEAMASMKKLKQYFPNDILFAQYIVRSNIIPENFDIDKAVKQIFADYKDLYSLYCEKISNEFVVANEFVLKNKRKILKELERRYLEILDIKKQNSFC